MKFAAPRRRRTSTPAPAPPPAPTPEQLGLRELLKLIRTFDPIAVAQVAADVDHTLALIAEIEHWLRLYAIALRRRRPQ